METTLAMAALYAEEKGWPGVQEITTEHLEEYLSYLQDRVRWFGGWTYAEPRKLSKGHINAQYRRLNRFFNWLVERGPNDENPMLSVSAPNLEEKTVPVITEDQMRDLLPLAAPVLARTPSPSLSPGLRQSTAVLVLGHARTACRDRKVATCGRGPNQWRAAGHGQGPERTEDAEGDTARSVMLDYLQEREVLMPRTKALWVSEQGDALLPNGICQVLKRLAKRAGIEDMDPPPLPPFPRYQRPEGRDAGASAEDSRRVGKRYPRPTSEGWGRRRPGSFTGR